MKLTLRRRQRSIVFLLGCLVAYQIYLCVKSGHERIGGLNVIPLSTLNEGSKLMSVSKVIFVGICRDNIQNVLDHIKYTVDHFLDYRIIIFENDSEDDTLQILKRFQAKDRKLSIISRTFKNIKRPTTKFMAEARNFYLNEMKKHEYDSFDYVIVVDMDMKYGWDVRGIQHTFSKSKRWDVSCANGISDGYYEMYDKFALRKDADNRTDQLLGLVDFESVNLTILLI